MGFIYLFVVTFGTDNTNQGGGHGRFNGIKFFSCNDLAESDLSLGLNSLSGETAYRKLSWSLEAASFGFIFFQSLWNLTDTEMPVKFQSETSILQSNLEILRKDVRPISE